ncbi:MAG: hypothetical protein ABSD92_13960 [Candidatus Bathyarchaeia archaeon]|jgi:hypothetical protein
MTETKKEERCPVNFDKATYQGKRFYAKGQGKTMAESERKLTEMLIQLVSIFDKNPFVVTYEISHYPDSHLVIRAEGQSTLSVGDFSKIPEAEKEKLRKALFDEVKLDIATIREKEVKVS